MEVYIYKLLSKFMYIIAIKGCISIAGKNLWNLDCIFLKFIRRLGDKNLCKRSQNHLHVLQSEALLI